MLLQNFQFPKWVYFDVDKQKMKKWRKKNWNQVQNQLPSFSFIKYIDPDVETFQGSPLLKQKIKNIPSILKLGEKPILTQQKKLTPDPAKHQKFITQYNLPLLQGDKGISNAVLWALFWQKENALFQFIQERGNDWIKHFGQKFNRAVKRQQDFKFIKKVQTQTEGNVVKISQVAQKTSNKIIEDPYLFLVSIFETFIKKGQQRIEVDGIPTTFFNMIQMKPSDLNNIHGVNCNLRGENGLSFKFPLKKYPYLIIGINQGSSYNLDLKKNYIICESMYLRSIIYYDEHKKKFGCIFPKNKDTFNVVNFSENKVLQQNQQKIKNFKILVLIYASSSLIKRTTTSTSTSKCNEPPYLRQLIQQKANIATLFQSQEPTNKQKRTIGIVSQGLQEKSLSQKITETKNHNQTEWNTKFENKKEILCKAIQYFILTNRLKHTKSQGLFSSKPVIEIKGDIPNMNIGKQTQNFSKYQITFPSQIRIGEMDFPTSIPFMSFIWYAYKLCNSVDFITQKNDSVDFITQKNKCKEEGFLYRGRIIEENFFIGVDSLQNYDHEIVYGYKNLSDGSFVLAYADQWLLNQPGIHVYKFSPSQSASSQITNSELSRQATKLKNYLEDNSNGTYDIINLKENLQLTNYGINHIYVPLDKQKGGSICILLAIENKLRLYGILSQNKDDITDQKCKEISDTVTTEVQRIIQEIISNLISGIKP